MFLADLYRVTAGCDAALRNFVTKTAAAKYAAEVVARSHRNIGLVCVQGRDGETGDWHTLIEVGTPTNVF